MISSLGGRGTSPSLSPAMQAAMAQLAALDPDLLSAAVQTLARLAHMPNPILLVSTRAADGTQSQADVTLSPGQMLTADASGNLITQPIPTAPAIRVGDFALTAAANPIGSTGTVTFSSPMPDAGYVLEIDYNGLAGLIKTIKSAAGFTYTVVNLLSGTPSYFAVQKV